MQELPMSVAISVLLLGVGIVIVGTTISLLLGDTKLRPIDYAQAFGLLLFFSGLVGFVVVLALG